MSREHFDQRVVEDFERELREALAIEPSPDFARQVRARIAARRAPVMWLRFALPIAAMCVLAVGLMIWMNREKDVVQLKPDATVKASTVNAPTVKASVAPEGSNLDTSKAASGFSRTLSAPVRIRPKAEPLPEPEIIVPPDRALALARLLELARSGSLNEEKLKPVASARPPATLEIAPLVVAPLSIPELETPSGTAQGGADRE